MRFDERAPVAQHLVGEVLHAAEVEEDDAPLGVEEVVAGVRIAVEHAVAHDRAEDEAEQDLALARARRLVVGEHVGEAAPVDELGGEHARRRVRGVARAGRG